MQDQEFERQLRRQDVQLLVTQLMRNEERTIKLILERLYDTGTVNWINQKVRLRPAKSGLKLVARCARPAGRYFGYRWLVKNTPRLITGWLFNQVAFKPIEVKAEVLEAKPASQAMLMNQQRQIKQLQKRLRLTAGVAALSLASFGGLLWVQHAEILTESTPQVTPVSQQQISP